MPFTFTYLLLPAALLALLKIRVVKKLHTKYLKSRHIQLCTLSVDIYIVYHIAQYIIVHMFTFIYRFCQLRQKFNSTKKDFPSFQSLLLPTINTLKQHKNMVQAKANGKVIVAYHAIPVLF